MRERTNRPEHGFTLIEVTVTFGIFMLILLAVLLIYSRTGDLRRRAERKLEVQQNARLAMAHMTRQIRLAGYFPENFGATPPLPAVANPVHVATDAAFAFHGDADGGGASGVFVYCLDGTRLRMTKQAAGTAIDCSAGTAIAENITSLRFSYFDEDGASLPEPPTPPFQLDGQAATGVPDLVDTSQRSTVRRVVIAMTARMDAFDIGSRTYTLTSDVSIRNGG